MKRSKSNIYDHYPIEITSITTIEGDCFGVEWEATHKECLSCSDYDICLIATKSKTDNKPDDVYFDLLDWDLVPWSDIINEIIDNPGELSVVNLRALVKEFSKCMDDTTVMYKVQNWILENGIKIESGCLYL